MPHIAQLICSLTLFFSNCLIVHGSSNELLPTQRSTRAAAVWGEPTPDFSLLSLGLSPQRQLRTLIFLDNKITEFYGYDMEEIKSKIHELLEEANTYFIQFRLGLVFVDVLQTDRGDLSLYTFQEYRNQRLHKLPPHDFAVLISFKYAGGLAFVGGMCSPQSVMLCGFYPQQPSAMGSIFFHEVAHLMGVPHKDPNSTLKVPHCTCRPVKNNVDEPCLRIPGFDHDCTAQQLANVVYKNRCLQSSEKVSTSISLCGNGLVEMGEQCDCGSPLQCSNVWNCVQHTCEYNIHPAWLWMIVIGVVGILLSLCILYGYRKGSFKWRASPNKPIYKSPLSNSGSFKHYASSPFHGKRNFPQSQISPSSIIVLLDDQSTYCPIPTTVTTLTTTTTLQRPKLPPPPPPKLLNKSTISVQMPNDVYEIPTSRLTVTDGTQDNLSWKFDDFDSGDDSSLPGSYEGQPGVPTVPLYPPKAPIQRVTVQFKGSDHTMSTECPSSSVSNGSLE